MKHTYTIGLIITIISIMFFFYYIDIHHIAKLIKTINLYIILKCSLIYVIIYIPKSIRWHYLLSNIKQIKFKSIFSATAIGGLANNLLPSHTGELIRTYVLAKENKISSSAVLATIIMEKIFDASVLLIYLIIFMIIQPFPIEQNNETHLIAPNTLKNIGIIALIIVISLLILLKISVGLKNNDKYNRFILYILKPLPKNWKDTISKLVEKFLLGIQISKKSNYFWIFIYSILIWFCVGLYSWFLFDAFNIDLPITVGILLQSIIAMSLLLPSAPSHIGTFQIAVILGLGYFGISKDNAGAYAVVLWAVQVLISSLLGGYFLILSGIKINKIIHINQYNKSEAL